MNDAEVFQIWNVGFLSPQRLWLLLIIPVLVLVYLLMQSRRKVYAARLASTDLLASVLPKRTGWRRHITAGALLLGLGSMLVGVAEPAREMEVERDRAVVMLAIDVSLSMEADDIQPSRLAAAQRAAIDFVDGLPPGLDVGLVGFAETAEVRVSPTRDRNQVIRSIQNLELQPATAIGEAIFTALEALQNTPVDDSGTIPPGTIVLLSDGETTVGRDDDLAIAAANEAAISVSTISFGTSDGFILYDDPETPQIEAFQIEVPVAEENLEKIADATGGLYFQASSLEELEAVYADIGSAVGVDTEFTEIADWFSGIAAILTLIAAALSLWWFQRLI
ncbi:MAG: VWA domain-containing protein [Acidimicrobiales bacterium]|nr:VWA domain-containing protein [Acidimicrobiales bacterium]